VGRRDGLDVTEKRKISCPYQESNRLLGRPTRSLVAVPAPGDYTHQSSSRDHPSTRDIAILHLIATDEAVCEIFKDQMVSRMRKMLLGVSHESRDEAVCCCAV
jgi:hypothetical protein